MQLGVRSALCVALLLGSAFSLSAAPAPNAVHLNFDIDLRPAAGIGAGEKYVVNLDGTNIGTMTSGSTKHFEGIIAMAGSRMDLTAYSSQSSESATTVLVVPPNDGKGLTYTLKPKIVTIASMLAAAKASKTMSPTDKAQVDQAGVGLGVFKADACEALCIGNVMKRPEFAGRSDTEILAAASRQCRKQMADYVLAIDALGKPGVNAEADVIETLTAKIEEFRRQPMNDKEYQGLCSM
jgi:hypothetical protein